MSSINKIAFRIIGLFALLTSMALLAVNIFQLGQSATLENLEKFISQITDLTINCIGIYGGIRLLQLKKAGHRLLTIWSLCRIFTAVLVILMLVTNLFFSGNNRFANPIPILFPFVMAYYVLSPAALVYLLASRASRELLADDDARHTHIMLRSLALLTPGLARAMVGNMAVGVILFYVYSGLMAFGRFSGGGELALGDIHFTIPDSWTNFLGKVSVWMVFAVLDWVTVKNHEKPQDERIAPVPNLDSSQVNDSE